MNGRASRAHCPLGQGLIPQRKRPVYLFCFGETLGHQQKGTGTDLKDSESSIRVEINRLISEWKWVDQLLTDIFT